jgi:hypothetical protein
MDTREEKLWEKDAHILFRYTPNHTTPNHIMLSRWESYKEKHLFKSKVYKKVDIRDNQ